MMIKELGGFYFNPLYYKSDATIADYKKYLSFMNVDIPKNAKKADLEKLAERFLVVNSRG